MAKLYVICVGHNLSETGGDPVLFITCIHAIHLSRLTR